MKYQIIIVGNGFDIELGGPTKYQNFLDFTKFVSKIRGLPDVNDNLQEAYNEYIFRNSDKNMSLYLDSVIKDRIVNPRGDYFEDEKIYLKGFYKLISKNFWISYFIQREKEIGHNWINFEDEISTIIKTLNNSMVTIGSDGIKRKSSMSDLIGDKFDMLRHEEYLQIVGRKAKTADLENISFETMHNMLLYDLKRLILALELYLSIYVEKVDVWGENDDCPTLSLRINKMFKKIKENKKQGNKLFVINFNYTDFMERALNKSFGKGEYEMCYVHGHIRSEGELKKCLKEYIQSGSEYGIESLFRDNKIVLGIGGDFRDGDDNDFVQFYKFFQKEYKKNDRQYKSWIKNLSDHEYENNEVYIFGHSLGIVDKEILFPVITSKYVSVISYPYDMIEYGSQLKRLIDMVGSEKAIEILDETNPDLTYFRFELPEMLSLIKDENFDEYFTDEIAEDED